MVLVYFLVFLYSALFSALIVIIGIWYIVYLLDIFLFVAFLYFSSHFLLWILFVRRGPRVLGHGEEFYFIFERRW